MSVRLRTKHQLVWVTASQSSQYTAPPAQMSAFHGQGSYTCSQRFGVDEPRLREAVAAVGDSADAVERHLRGSD